MCGITPAAWTPSTLRNLLMSQGSAEATIAPSPMKRLCIAKPWVLCSSGRRSATKARKGSMLMLILASSIQSNPAAIHKAEQFGIRISAAELRMAPVRK